MKPRAHYRIACIRPGTIWVIDLDDGAMSVTNDAEAVVAALVAQYGDRRIMYRDTEGNWDELEHENGRFLDYAAGALLERIRR
jgi:uncharacterized protein involved in tellurium resistance